MKKQEPLTVKGLQLFIDNEDMTYASSERECKKLVCTLRGGLKVLVGHKVVWEGMQPFAAVEKYNSITEKYIDPVKDFKI